VEYLIEACIEVEGDIGLGGVRNGQPRWKTVQVLAKYHQMFLRRARTGQCFYQPFFGCREFSVAEWELVEEFDQESRGWRLPSEDDEQMRSVNDHFGFTFRDFDFGQFWEDFEGRNFNSDTGMPKLTAARPLCAKATNGWINVNRIENGRVVAA
jgi:hypothetical protein